MTGVFDRLSNDDKRELAPLDTSITDDDRLSRDPDECDDEPLPLRLRLERRRWELDDFFLLLSFFLALKRSSFFEVDAQLFCALAINVFIFCKTGRPSLSGTPSTPASADDVAGDGLGGGSPSIQVQVSILILIQS